MKQTKVWDRYGNDSLQSFVDQVGPQRLAEMTAALEAAAREAESLQNRQENGTMQEARNSVKGKYWRPNLTQKEWSLLNRRMEQEINDPAHTLDESMQWAYANGKGIQIFAIYGIGDGTEATPLYAVGGKRAKVAYDILLTRMEDAQNGFDANRTDFSFWAADIRGNQKYGSRNPDADERAGRSANRSNQLHVGTSEGDTEGASGTGNRDGKVSP